MRAGRPRSQGMVIAAVCAIRMTVSRDHGGTWFPTPPPAGGFGRATPSQEQPVFIPSVRCGCAAAITGVEYHTSVSRG